MDFLLSNANFINILCSIFTALGTVGSVITALYISLRESKPKLKVFATVGIITPEMSEHLWISCINIGKQPVLCNSFAFAPRKSKPHRIWLRDKLEDLSNIMPIKLNYSDRVDQHFGNDFFTNKEILKFLGRYKWFAKIKLKLLWRISINTNIGNFYGKLSSNLIDKILSSQFPKN